MKRLALILTAAILSASVILSGCKTTKLEDTDKNKETTNKENLLNGEVGDNTEEKEETEDITEEAEQYNAFENAAVIDYLDNNSYTTATPEQATQYNAAAEARLETLQPKAELDNEILAYVNGIPVSAATVRYAKMACYATYMDTDKSEEEINQEIEDFYRVNAALLTLCTQNGIEISDQEYKESVEVDILGMQTAYGDELASMFEDSPYTPFFYYLNQSVYVQLFDSLVNFYTADVNSPLMLAAREATLEYLNQNDYVRAKHILIQFPTDDTGAVDESKKAETLEKANQVLEKVNAMNDISEFDALIAEYNDDPGMTSYPDGYYFTRGEMVAPFEEAAYSLEEGQTSGIVETNYGYHILLKLPIDDEKLSENEICKSMATSIFNELLYRIGDTYEITYADNYDARSADFIAEYDEMIAEAEAQE